MSALYSTLGSAQRSFECCDTDFTVQVSGIRADAAAERAETTAYDLEAQLDAFDADSAVAELNRVGEVENRHVARIVERGLEYTRRTGGRFDLRHGGVEHDVKAYIRGDAETVEAEFTEGTVTVDGDHVTSTVAVDLNGLAKGYLVDWTASELCRPGRTGFVDGGGDISPPTGLVGVESPYGDEKPLRTVDTDWSIASSGGYKRTRGDLDHIYDPLEQSVGAVNDLVTVVARRDCMEADALATVLSTLPPIEAVDFVEDWPGAEAFLVHQGLFYESSGFEAHRSKSCQ